MPETEEREDSETEERDDSETEAREDSDTEAHDDDEVTEEDATAPGDWERKPADEEDLRHDDGSEPLAEPVGDDGDDDLAEQEEGDVSAGDEGFDRQDPPEEAGLEDTGDALGKHSEPLLEGSEIKTPVGDLPTRSLLAMAAFIVIFCAAFFGLWALMGNFGILLGLVVGTALGLGAMKLMADRAS